MAMSLSATSGGTDSGVETGNESNDIDLNASTSSFHGFDVIDNDGVFLIVPPPPPTSPESSHEETYGGAVDDDCITDMDRDIDINEDEQVEHRKFWEHNVEDLCPVHIMNQSCKQLTPHPFVIPMFSPPPAPPATPTNTCKALIKFEFPELPKLTCQFVDPPAGLQNFLSVEEFKLNHTKGYNIVKPGPDNCPQKTTSCTALIPYEQRDIQKKSQSHSRNPWRKVMGKKVRNQCLMSGRLEYNERRLRAAANTKNIPVLTKILQSGVDPNAADELGRTALHIAACKGFCEVVRLLLQSGANPNRKDSVGNTPLHLAACTNHFDVVTCLLRAGTDVSTLDNNGRNPLQLAQSKLKLIACSSQQPATEDAIKIKMEVQQIIEMMLEYLQKKGQDIGTELLNAFASRLTLSQTPDEVDADVKNLLANLSSLTLSTPLPQNNSLCSTSFSTLSSFSSEIPSSSRPYLHPAKLSVSTLTTNSNTMYLPDNSYIVKNTVQPHESDTPPNRNSL